MEPFAQEIVTRKIFGRVFLYEAYCSYLLPLSFSSRDAELQVFESTANPDKNKLTQIDIAGKSHNRILLGELESLFS